jgi:hypothetical protein
MSPACLLPLRGGQPLGGRVALVDVAAHAKEHVGRRSRGGSCGAASAGVLRQGRGLLGDGEPTEQERDERSPL